MVNAVAPWGNGHLAPAGPLRERIPALARADVIAIHHADLVLEQRLHAIRAEIRAVCPAPPLLLHTRMAAHSLQHVAAAAAAAARAPPPAVSLRAGAAEPIPPSQGAGCNCRRARKGHLSERGRSLPAAPPSPPMWGGWGDGPARGAPPASGARRHVAPPGAGGAATGVSGAVCVCLSGVGCPEALELCLYQLGAEEVVSMRFEDHHEYAPEDFARVREEYRAARRRSRGGRRVLVVTTEKDFARGPEAMQRGLAHLDAYVLRSKLEVMESVDGGNTGAEFDLLLAKALRGPLRESSHPVGSRLSPGAGL